MNRPKVPFSKWFVERYGTSYGQATFDKVGEGLVAYVEEAVARLEAKESLLGTSWGPSQQEANVPSPLDNPETNKR